MSSLSWLHSKTGSRLVGTLVARRNRRGGQLPAWLRRCIGSVALLSLLAPVSCSAPAGGSNPATDGKSSGDESSGDELLLDGSSDELGDSSADTCVEASALSMVPPATVLIGLDRSLSMTKEERWTSVTAALEAFFADPNSAGLNATLQFFPMIGEGEDDEAVFCAAESYASPDVPLTPLPNAAPFSAVLDVTEPGGWTPTLGVVGGLITQAEASLAAAPQTPVAMVLVMDGTPGGCDPYADYTTSKVAELVGSVADRVPTYVIGIGDALENLHTVAEAGGTGSAVLVDSTDPDGTRTEVLARLESIRGELEICDVAIPAPPEGKELDPFKVTTRIVAATGEVVAVSYEADCATSSGWHYDNLSAPEVISLCPQACIDLKATGQGNLDVVFGCTENPEIVK